MAKNTELFDDYSRTIRPVLCNTAKDGSGTWYFALVDSDGHLQVDALSAAIASIAAGTNLIGKVGIDQATANANEIVVKAGAARIGIVLEDPHEVRVATVIDASLGAYAAHDVVGNEDCCSTTATYWTFAGMANAVGGYGVIDFSTIFSETPNIAPRLTLLLFNAAPTGELRDNWPNTNPLPADRSKYVGRIEHPALNKESAAVASTAEASPSTTGNLPLRYKCATASTTLYGVLITEDIFTQVATNDIEIALQIRHL